MSWIKIRKCSDAVVFCHEGKKMGEVIIWVIFVKLDGDFAVSVKH